MSKINGLFLDYDGTLSPLDVSRQQSKIPPHLEALFNIIRKYVPIGVITSKDMPFILPRTDFAHAWAAIAGLELKIGSQLFISRGIGEALPLLNQALKYAKRNTAEGGVIEEKCSYTGQPLAFCVDWREVKDDKAAREMSSHIRAYCHTLALEVIEYHGNPYFDVFPCPMDKGQAITDLRNHMSLSSGTLYMGDSITDNLAFKKVDIGIGVSENLEPLDLECQYWIKFEDVANFFSFLYKNDFNFSPDLPGIKARG